MWVRFPPPALGFERFSTLAVTDLDKIWTRKDPDSVKSRGLFLPR